MFRDKIISKAKELGFNLVGFSKYRILWKEIKQLEEWLSKSYQAGMHYMEKNIEKRRNLKEILPDCESIISLGMNYYLDESFDDNEGEGKISRYAWGRDYHLVIWEKLEELIGFMENEIPGIKAVSYVDTGPHVMDKIWAVESGLGWQGKHSNIINKEIGSWFFIANIFTNHIFEIYDQPISDFCGTCTACIDACPTNAIVEDYVIDSNKCISYLTIENKGEIPDEFLGKFENWIFGCDICQEVCPWNIKFAEETYVHDFKTNLLKSISLNEPENLTNKLFKEKFEESPLLRAKVKGLKRNSEFLKELESK